MTKIPAEWRPHKAVWTAWPSAADLWGEDLEPARAEVAAMVRALADGGRGDRMRVIAHGREAEATAKLALGQSAEVIPGAFGDIWFRDTGPIFTADARALGFRFNGWGGKYQLPHDEEVAARIALIAGAEFKRCLQDKHYRRATEIGEQIMADFPNTRMAEEIRHMIDGVREKAAARV